MGFKCGIIGLPNVGKSTIFNALTSSTVNVANYPFCTIDPNVGVVPVNDNRLQELAAIAHSKNIIPTFMEFVDIAGLVRGASKGEGLGNQFLSHIRETQAIAHVVRCFDDNDISHVSGNINPMSDIEIIDTELILADLETIDRLYNKKIKNNKCNKSDVFIKELDILSKIKNFLEKGELIRSHINEIDIPIFIQQLNLLTLKPVFYIANVSETISNSDHYFSEMLTLARTKNTKVIPICAKIEFEISQMNTEDRVIFLRELGLKYSGLDKIITSGYNLLKLGTFFTVGPKETRAWTFINGIKAVQAAGIIHSDFERGFICVEVISYEDYINCKGEQGAKEMGKIRLEGKNYKISDGDIVKFRFNV